MYPIEFNDISKKFRMGEKVYALRDAIPKLFSSIFKGYGKKLKGLKEGEFWAVKNVDFRMKKGEVLGIIGPNGAGKSTILKLLSKITKPTGGEFVVRGRLSALIEVTAGFHPDFTGRENVYFNGAVLGMTKKEVDEKFDEIVEFAGIGDFIDTPVKRYSSGMSARLGFAVAAHVDPDVLLVDEVLSVGDMTFQGKCVQKMKDLLDSGVTIIFVSHNIALVQSLCQRVILLHKGEAIADGSPEEVIPEYERLVNEMTKGKIQKQMESLTVASDSEANSNVVVKSVEFLNSKLEKQSEFRMDEPIVAKIDFVAMKEAIKPSFGVAIMRPDGVRCCYTHSGIEHFTIDKYTGEGSLYLHMEPTYLASGTYFTRISVWDEALEHPIKVFQRGIFKINAVKRGYTNCVLILKSTWSLNKPPKVK